MRKLASRFLALAGVSMFALILTGVLPIMPSSVSAEAADVVRGEGCVFFDADGTAYWDADSNIQWVYTNNGNGNVNVRCIGSLPEGADLPTQAMHWDYASTGYTCSGGQTWDMTVSPSGRASFTCHLPD